MCHRSSALPGPRKELWRESERGVSTNYLQASFMAALRKHTLPCYTVLLWLLEHVQFTMLIHPPCGLCKASASAPLNRVSLEESHNANRLHGTSLVLYISHAERHCSDAALPACCRPLPDVRGDAREDAAAAGRQRRAPVALPEPAQPAEGPRHGPVPCRYPSPLCLQCCGGLQHTHQVCTGVCSLINLGPLAHLCLQAIAGVASHAQTPVKSCS